MAFSAAFLFGVCVSFCNSVALDEICERKYHNAFVTQNGLALQQLDGVIKNDERASRGFSLLQWRMGLSRLTASLLAQNNSAEEFTGSKSDTVSPNVAIERAEYARDWRHEYRDNPNVTGKQRVTTSLLATRHNGASHNALTIGPVVAFSFLATVLC
eukprot:TRINITY_DN4917_c0_g1_i1.p1 TRINITY_DN4917_c0_g1~~TRINITY_DN4917_c0_g1_i1.p1  ORF type:complete len:157 (+),score=12.26 TRINITY_DN4917_c0_g1_i1:89-559(+)